MSQETILVIAPHPDDESIGCGGSIALHHSAGNKVAVLFLTSGEQAMKQMPPAEVWRMREAEARKALQILSAESAGFLHLPDGNLCETIATSAIAVADSIASIRPDRIYLPHINEEHADHTAVLPILGLAYQKLGRAEPWLLAYEVWTPLDRYDLMEDISQVYQTKISAVRCYESQLKQFDYARGVTGLNAYRGAMAGHCEYAEVFASVTFPSFD